MSNSTIVTSVPLGDVVQRVAQSILSHLQNLLASMVDQDPELRTTHLLFFVQHSRKKMLQLLALVRWLSQASTLRFFNSLDMFSQSHKEIENMLARYLDEMYFTHGKIYPLRSVEYNIPLAHSIMSTGTYVDLPEVLFSRGKKVFPQPKAVQELQKKLDTFIRAKLIFVDPLAKQFFQINSLSVQLNGGIVQVKHDRYFTTYLTLHHLSKDAPWKPICLFISRDGPFLENQLDIIDNFAKSRAQYISFPERIKNTLQGFKDASARLDLSIIVKQSFHAALSQRLFDYYDALALLFSKQKNFGSIFKLSLLRPSEVISCAFQVDLWRSVYSNEFQFSVRVYLDSFSLTTKVCTDSRLEYRVEVMGQQRPTETMQGSHLVVTNVSDAFGIKKIINASMENGATPEDTINRMLVELIKAKVSFLYRRLDASHDLRQRIRLSSTDTTLSIEFVGSSFSLLLRVDGASGQFVFDKACIGPISSGFAERFSSFLLEINNVESERLFVKYLSIIDDEPSIRKLLGPIDTLAILVVTVDHLYIARELGFYYKVVSEAEERQLINTMPAGTLVTTSWITRYWNSGNIYDSKVQMLLEGKIVKSSLRASHRRAHRNMEKSAAVGVVVLYSTYAYMENNTSQLVASLCHANVYRGGQVTDISVIESKVLPVKENVIPYISQAMEQFKTWSESFVSLSKRPFIPTFLTSLVDIPSKLKHIQLFEYDKAIIVSDGKEVSGAAFRDHSVRCVFHTASIFREMLARDSSIAVSDGLSDMVALLGDGNSFAEIFIYLFEDISSKRIKVYCDSVTSLIHLGDSVSQAEAERHLLLLVEYVFNYLNLSCEFSIEHFVSALEVLHAFITLILCSLSDISRIQQSMSFTLSHSLRLLDVVQLETGPKAIFAIDEIESNNLLGFLSAELVISKGGFNLLLRDLRTFKVMSVSTDDFGLTIAASLYSQATFDEDFIEEKTP